MATVDLSEQTFESTVVKGGIVLVDFWADWCGPCKAFAPIYDATSASNDDIVFAKVDTDANQGLSSAMGIQAIPTLMAFRDGIGVFSQAGALPRPALEDLITQVRALDMDAVRAEIATTGSAPAQGDDSVGGTAEA
jgi:thioredoxin 1